MNALLRRGAFAAARMPFFAPMLDALERSGSADAFGVLVYHRIARRDPRSTLDPRLISATPEAFDEQLEYLAARANPVALEELLDVRRGRERLRPRSVLVTFDDAYRDFATRAWPLLRRHGVPATLFVPTGYPDNPDRVFWWDRLHAAVAGTLCETLELPGVSLPLRSDADRRAALRWVRDRVHALEHDDATALVDEVELALGAERAHNDVLSWDELRRLAREGLSVAPHTRTHPLLPRLGAAQAREEIVGSIVDLEREVGIVQPAFAYPGGAHSEAVVAAVKEAGIELAFTVARGSNAVGDLDWHRLRRINVGVRTPMTIVRMQLLRSRSAVGVS